MQHLSPAAAQRPFAGKLLIADRGNNRLLVLNPSGNVTWTYPSPKLPAPPVPFYFPDDAFWVHGGHAILVNEEENDVLAEIAYPSGKTLWTYGHPRVGGSSTGIHPPARRPLPLPRRRLGGRGREELPGAVLRSGGPPERTGRPDRELHPRAPETVGYPNGATPMPNGDLLVSEINGARISRLRANKTVDLDDDRARSPHAVGSAADDRRLDPRRRLRASRGGHPFQPVRKVLWTYRPTSGSGVLDHPSLGAPLPNGLIAVNDDYNDRVVLIDPVTNSIAFQYGHTGVAGTGPGYSEHPRWPGPPAPRRRHPAPRRLRQPEGPPRPSVTQS